MSSLAKSVLVVDDEPAMRMALQANFQRDGWQVETACGATDALRKLEQQRFPLVVTDIRMPDGDGLTALGRIKLDKPNLPILILSTFDNPTYVARAVA
jgi:DNA-binding NtrC family response regulator